MYDVLVLRYVPPLRIRLCRVCLFAPGSRQGWQKYFCVDLKTFKLPLLGRAVKGTESKMRLRDAV